jgi:hypothetical protein
MNTIPTSTPETSAVNSTSAPSAESIAGFNVLLIGPAGTGKTHSIGTLVDSGVEVFFLALESGIESLFGYYTDKGKPIPSNLHWHTLKAPKATFLDLMENAKSINTMSLETLSKAVDPNRAKHNQFIELLTVLNDFPDEATGQKFGAVNTWKPNRALVIDGMTGIGRAAMSLVIGGKAVKNQSDWGIAQDQVEKVLRMLCDNCRCHFVLLAHVERETDQVMGGTKLMVATLGRALAPKIPPMFSDVILAVRASDKWNWDTGTPMADVKARNMPFAGNLPASFAPLITKWKSRGGLLT